MLAGIREVLIISTPHDLPLFRRLLGDGSRFGMRLDYAEQPRPDGLVQAFLIGRDFLAGGPACLVLGDNLFYGQGLGEVLRRAARLQEGSRIFAHRVRDPQHYGVVELDADGRAIGLEEKPVAPRSHYAVPGLYFYGPDVCEVARGLRPGPRGELEITDLNRVYLARGTLAVEQLGRGTAWFDTGTHRSLLDAATFIAAIQERQGTQVACLEEIAWRQKWIDAAGVEAAAAGMGGSSYGEYLRDILRSGAAD
jgi:glucose-1-phosphate thymidylyltransferase